MKSASRHRFPLLFLLLLISAPSNAQPAGNEHDQAVAALRKLGGQIHKDKDGSVHVSLAFDWKGSNDDLVHVKKLAKVTRLDLRSDKFSDACLVHVKDLGDLKLLILESRNFSDAGFEDFKNLTSLENLQVQQHTQVTGTGLRHL